MTAAAEGPILSEKIIMTAAAEGPTCAAKLSLEIILHTCAVIMIFEKEIAPVRLSIEVFNS
jgi:hypothetical protein